MWTSEMLAKENAELRAEVARLSHDLDACRSELGYYQQITDEHLLLISGLVAAAEAAPAEAVS